MAIYMKLWVNSPAHISYFLNPLAILASTFVKTSNTGLKHASSWNSRKIPIYLLVTIQGLKNTSGPENSLYGATLTLIEKGQGIYF